MKKIIFIVLFLACFTILALTTLAVTTNYYPLAGDGCIYKDDTDWFLARNATSGTLSIASGWVFSRWQAANSYGVGRYFATFDTTALPTNASISSASVYLYQASKGGTNTRSYGLYNSNHSNTVVAGDLDLAGTTVQSSTTFDHSAISDGQWLIFPLNSQGIASIIKGGYTKFSCREVSKDVANSAPTDAYQNVYITITPSSGANKPYLSVTYTNTTNTTSGLGAMEIGGD